MQISRVESLNKIVPALSTKFSAVYVSVLNREVAIIVALAWSVDGRERHPVTS